MSNEYSKNLVRRAQAVIPGGVNSPVRSFNSVGGLPPIIDSALSAKITDVDNNNYLDFMGSWGPLILGHAHPKVVKAVQDAAARGLSFGATTEGEIQIAEMIVEAIPSMESIRFVNSGTEAVMSAIRVARALTGKNKVVKFNGGYHGHSDGLLVNAGSGAATHGVATSLGIPKGFISETLVAEFNRLDSVDRLMSRYRSDVAAIIVEPIGGNMGVVPPMAGFLEGLRALADKHRSMLIFDEVITGFRVRYGGVQDLYNVRPDITCLGKIIGGGLPVGAYGAPKSVMDLISPIGSVYQAGTLSGNPVTVAAGLATLTELAKPGIYESLEAHGAALEKALWELSNRPLVINRVGSMLTVFFGIPRAETWTDISASDTQTYAQFFHFMLSRGIYFPPSQFEAMFVSTAHTMDDIGEVYTQAREFSGATRSA